MIRILHIVHKMDRGGIQSFIMNVYRNIDREKVQFDFLVTKDSVAGYYDKEILSLGGQIHQVPKRKQGYLNSIKAMKSFFREHQKYKIVHAHMSSLSNVSFLRIAKEQGVPYRIVHSHNTRQGGSVIHKYIHQFNKLFLKSFANEYFSCSDLAAKWMFSREIYENKEFKIINNAIETEKFIYNAAFRKEIRADLKIENKFVIGHVGRFHPQKNHEYLLDIFKEIKAKNKDSILLLVGDGALRSKIESKIKQNNLEDSVILTGVRSDVESLLHAMDVFVLPSLYEGFPVTVVETQAAGLKSYISDKITKDIKIIDDLVYALPIGISAETWANEILKNKNYYRDNRSLEIEKAGFDIVKETEKLQNYYLNLVNS